MGCGSSRNQETRPLSPSASPPPEAVPVEADIDSKRALELKFFESDSSSGDLKSFKALALSHTAFVQKVSVFR